MRTQQPIDVRPVLLVLIGSLGIQSSALISSTLFAQLGTVAVSTFRLVLASAIMLVVFRPPLRRFSRARWMNAGVYGVALAAMNQFYFAAVDRIPLGVAVTLDFLGPACVSFFGLRHSKERHWAIVAFVGVVLIAGPSSGLDRLGILFGLLAGAFFGLYTVYAERLGKAEGGLGDLAISVSVAALVALPFTFQEVTALDLHAVAVLAIAALVGVVIPYVADTLAARYSSAAVVGTLFALDPVVGSLLGWLVAGDSLTVRMVTGIAFVTVAGAVMTWRSTPR
ncbi:EamA family transporter [Corynebacterium ureicelerivorans]|uniref:EamA family transporter n=1 Tax=Corynebacterium ureicelerivorans TaxID=401472 RepID=UPI0006901861|nr:EamA family transporter [Corynebacterium ureicelerivorans]